jgi:hypothetical protein
MLIVQLFQTAMKEIITLLPLEGEIGPGELVCVLIDVKCYRACVEKIVDDPSMLSSCRTQPEIGRCQSWS